MVNLVEKNKNMKMWTKPEFGLVLFKICNKEGIPDEEITKKVQEKVANIEEGYLTAANYKENYAIRICICNE